MAKGETGDPGEEFRFGGRRLKVARRRRSVVIAEETEAVGEGLPGQLSIWPARTVNRLQRQQKKEGKGKHG